jgi:hypothetical protein
MKPGVSSTKKAYAGRISPHYPGAVHLGIRAVDLEVGRMVVGQGNGESKIEFCNTFAMALPSSSANS